MMSAGIGKTYLRFLRDTDKRGIDFVVLKEGLPLFAVESKTGEKNISPFLFPEARHSLSALSLEF